MENGKISVIMGIYNCADTLPQAIDSILTQTYSHWELILCDDCSTDNTYSVAEIYQKKYPERIRLIQNSANSKLSYTLNHCLQYADGEYVARMDGDDYCAPERFEKQVAFLQKHLDVDLVGCAMQRFNDDGLADVDYQVEHPTANTLRKRTPFHHATILTYKRVYDALGGYTVSERTVRGQDYDLWFRFFHAGFHGENLMEPLYYVREDMAAIKRRTFHVRWNAFRTTVYGYRLLGFPTWWLIQPFFSTVFKSLVPYRCSGWYRNRQKRANNEREKSA